MVLVTVNKMLYSDSGTRFIMISTMVIVVGTRIWLQDYSSRVNYDGIADEDDYDIK